MNYLNRTTLHLAVSILAGLLLQALPLQGQQFEWAGQIGGSYFANGTSVAVDANGNVYTTGTFFGTVDFDPGAGVLELNSREDSTAIFVTKTNSTGGLIWARCMTGGQFSSGSGLGVAVDSTGNVYVTGSYSRTIDFDPGPGIFELASESYVDAFLVKLNSVGGFVWAGDLASGDPASGNGVAVDSSGNVFVTGQFTGTADFDPGPGVLLLAGGSDSVFVTKLNSEGGLVWARVKTRGIGRGVAVDSSGNVYVTGAFYETADFGPKEDGSALVRTSEGQADIFVMKLDSAGDSLWVQAMGGPGFDHGLDVALDASGNVYTTGSFTERAIFKSIALPSGGVRTTALTSAGDADVFVSKHTAAGSLLWVKQMGGSARDQSNGIAVDASGNVYTTGLYGGIADFNPSSSVSNLIAGGDRDAFLNKLDSGGNFEWVRQLGGDGTNEGYGVALDGNANVYTTGTFESTAYFDLDLDGVFSGGTPVFESPLTSFGSTDAFVAKFNDLSEAGEQPLISEGGIVLATLLPTVNTISPRSIISVFGENFSTTTTLDPEVDGNGNLARSLGGSCLEMNGERLPIFAMTPTQINAQASASQTFGPASFRVITNCNTSNALLSEPVEVALASDAETATVETATPGFFLFEPLADDGVIAARFNADNVAVAPAGLFTDDFGPSRPAEPGDIVVLYGTGWGPTKAALGTGQLATEAAWVLDEANPTVSFGGIFLAPEDVLYVGVTPNAAGLYQLAIRVPAGAQTGNHQVVLTVYSKSTPIGPVMPVLRP